MKIEPVMPYNTKPGPILKSHVFTKIPDYILFCEGIFP